jgi:Cu-processing system permease protein
VLFSTSVSPVLAAVFTMGVFAVGHLSQSIRDFGMLQDSLFQRQVSELVYYLIPNLEVFNLRGAVVHGSAVSFEHLVMATVYSLAWTAILLVVAGSIFSRKELRGE